MSKTITYPRKGIKLRDVLNQETLDRLTARLFGWQQGPGCIGGLHLHSCWGETSVLARRYQGQTTFNYNSYIHGSMTLFERTGGPRWKRFADDIASNLLFLQCSEGGFRHACNEFEPSYNSGKTCPIHQGMPLLALLDYAAWKHADPYLRALIKPAVDRHWKWFYKAFWRIGAGPHRPLRADHGWCGVTNQDLTIIAVLSAYGRLYGDFSRYEKYGKPTLNVFLSPDYYYEQIGLFERGDGNNFTERTPYYHIILPLLERIYNDTGDERLPRIVKNVSLHLFDAAFTAPDGLTHLAWGAKTDPDDKSRVLEWIQSPVVFERYPELVYYMEKALKDNPDEEKALILEGLKESFAAYVFYDGGMPAALWPKDPAIAVAETSKHILWEYLINYLGDAVCDPAPVPVACLHRSLGEFTWKTNGTLWALEKDGERVFGGYKPLPHAVTHGPQEEPVFGSFSDLEICDIHEIITINRS